jgi:hypothetical protein
MAARCSPTTRPVRWVVDLSTFTPAAPLSGNGSTGTGAVTINAGGILTAGLNSATAGTLHTDLTVNGNTTITSRVFNTSATPSPTPVPGTDFDQVADSASVTTLGASTASPINVQLTLPLGNSTNLSSTSSYTYPVLTFKSITLPNDGAAGTPGAGITVLATDGGPGRSASQFHLREPLHARHQCLCQQQSGHCDRRLVRPGIEHQWWRKRRPRGGLRPVHRDSRAGNCDAGPRRRRPDVPGPPTSQGVEARKRLKWHGRPARVSCTERRWHLVSKCFLRLCTAHMGGTSMPRASAASFRPSGARDTLTDSRWLL